MHDSLISKHLETKVNVDLMRADGPCWLTYLKVNKAGYCRTSSRSFNRGAADLHVLAWEWANDRRVPKGLTVNHKCHMKWCWNPAHLELMTSKQQARDRDLYHGRTAKDFCDKHQVDKVRDKNDRLYCRLCNNESSKASRARKKEAELALT